MSKTNNEAAAAATELATKLASLPTKSARIRYLHSIKYTTGAIAKLLDIRYQHVRNVLITPVTTPKQ